MWPSEIKKGGAIYCSNDCKHTHALSREKTDTRFWGKVNKSGTQVSYMDSRCWEWKSSIGSSDYGTFGTVGRTWGAHRYSFAIHNPDVVMTSDLFVCHHCDNRRCVRPDHLFLGTQKDNLQDAKRKGRLGKREQRECEHCDTVFECIPSDKKRYCTYECWTDYRRAIA